MERENENILIQFKKFVVLDITLDLKLFNLMIANTHLIIQNRPNLLVNLKFVKL